MNNRILVLAPTVPASLEDKVPWHFFQELGGIANMGNEVCVVSSRMPRYEIHRVAFRELSDSRGSGRQGAALGSAKLMLRYCGITPFLNGSGRRGMRMSRMNFNLLRIVREWKPRVIHSHWAYPGNSGGWLAAAAAGIPLVMTLRGIDHLINRACGYGDTLDPFRESVFKQALNSAACVTICCTDSETRLQELGFEQWGKVRHVYHAVNAARFQGTGEEAKSVRQRLGFISGKVASCVAGMDHGRKGHAILLYAFEKALRSGCDLNLVLVGDGPLRGSLEDLTKKLGLSERVHFVGRQHPNEIQHFIRLSDFTVLPTLTEAFGNVVFESLVVGTPVISTAVGAAKDVLPKGPFGFLCRPGDPDDLARAMVEVLDNENIAKAMAAAGAVFVIKEMSLAKRIAAFTGIYEELAGQ